LLAIIIDIDNYFTLTIFHYWFSLIFYCIILLHSHTADGTQISTLTLLADTPWLAIAIAHFIYDIYFHYYIDTHIVIIIVLSLIGHYCTLLYWPLYYYYYYAMILIAAIIITLIYCFHIAIVIDAFFHYYISLLIHCHYAFHYYYWYCILIFHSFADIDFILAITDYIFHLLIFIIDIDISTID